MGYHASITQVISTIVNCNVEMELVFDQWMTTFHITVVIAMDLRLWTALTINCVAPTWILHMDKLTEDFEYCCCRCDHEKNGNKKPISTDKLDGHKHDDHGYCVSKLMMRLKNESYITYSNNSCHPGKEPWTKPRTNKWREMAQQGQSILMYTGKRNWLCASNSNSMKNQLKFLLTALSQDECLLLYWKR